LWNTEIPRVDYHWLPYGVAGGAALLIEASKCGGMSIPQHARDVFQEEQARRKLLDPIEVGVDEIVPGIGDASSF
jgi:hypothetical protein